MNTAARAPKALPIIRSDIQSESEFKAARQRARRLAELLDRDRRDQTGMATEVSEPARNASIPASLSEQRKPAGAEGAQKRVLLIDAGARVVSKKAISQESVSLFLAETTRAAP